MGITERKEREKLQRRNDIINAAEKVFSEMGFEDSTMSDIAEKAELSKGTLYLYFKSKEELHLEVGLIALEKITEFINSKTDDNNPGLENLKIALKAYLEFSEEYPTFYRAILEFESSKLDKVDAEDKSRIIQQGSPLYLLRDMLAKGIEDGSLRKDIDPMQMVIMLWSQLSGMQQFIRNRVKLINLLDIDADDMLNKHIQIIADGIVNRER